MVLWLWAIYVVRMNPLGIILQGTIQPSNQFIGQSKNILGSSPQKKEQIIIISIFLFHYMYILLVNSIKMTQMTVYQLSGRSDGVGEDQPSILICQGHNNVCLRKCSFSIKAGIQTHWSNQTWWSGRLNTVTPQKSEQHHYHSAQDISEKLFTVVSLLDTQALTSEITTS